MAELKTQKNDASVEDFLSSVDHEVRRQDGFAVLEMMKELTGEEPKMWGDSMVGFGDYRYSYKSGRKGEWFLTGFSPRKQNMTLYILSGIDDTDPLLQQLGKHTLGKGCLYINKLADVDQNVLRQMVAQSYANMKATHSS